MRALVVYESMYGNTQAIAEAVAEGLADHASVDLVEVGAAPAAVDDDVALLVVGGPTHAFGMTRPGTRQDAATKTDRPLVSAGKGLREWLEELEGRRARPATATFDTRIDKPRVPGSAARGAHKRLRRAGFEALAPAESFSVTDSLGPLLAGERDRARAWGTRLGAKLAARHGAASR